jgi:beta-xylosidase
MHLFPGGPIMRSSDLVHWEAVSYLFDEIKDTPRYDLKEGSVYGRGQWATSLRYHKGTFWALFVANDDPHKSMVFKTTDPTKGWDGTYQGNPVKDGVYFVYVKARGADGIEYNIRRDVNLIRNFNIVTNSNNE